MTSPYRCEDLVLPIERSQVIIHLPSCLRHIGGGPLHALAGLPTTEVRLEAVGSCKCKYYVLASIPAVGSANV